MPFSVAGRFVPAFGRQDRVGDVNDFKGIINVGNGNYSYDLTFGFNSESNDE